MGEFVLAGRRLVDLGGSVPALFRYAFVRAGSVDAELSGYFVDLTGTQIGQVWSATIGATPVSMVSLYGEPLPDDAAGFIGRLTQDVHIGLGGWEDGMISIGMSPGPAYPVLAAADFVILGRVG